MSKKLVLVCLAGAVGIGAVWACSSVQDLSREDLNSPQTGAGSGDCDREIEAMDIGQVGDQTTMRLSLDTDLHRFSDPMGYYDPITGKANILVSVQDNHPNPDADGHYCESYNAGARDIDETTIPPTVTPYSGFYRGLVPANQVSGLVAFSSRHRVQPTGPGHSWFNNVFDLSAANDSSSLFGYGTRNLDAGQTLVVWTSADGATWTEQTPTSIVSRDRINAALGTGWEKWFQTGVRVKPAGGYRMFVSFTGEGVAPTKGSIYSLGSSDGVNWSIESDMRIPEITTTRNGSEALRLRLWGPSVLSYEWGTSSCTTAFFTTKYYDSAGIEQPTVDAEFCGGTGAGNQCIGYATSTDMGVTFGSIRALKDTSGSILGNHGKPATLGFNHLQVIRTPVAPLTLSTGTSWLAVVDHHDGTIGSPHRLGLHVK